MIDINEFDEQKSVEFLEKILKASGLKYRRTKPGEEGGFFYVEDGVRKKFIGNIFIKRSIKAELGECKNDERK